MRYRKSMNNIINKLWYLGVSGLFLALYIWLTALYSFSLPADYQRFFISTFGDFEIYLGTLFPGVIAAIFCSQIVRLIARKLSIIDTLIILLPTTLFILNAGMCTTKFVYFMLACLSLPIFSYFILNHFSLIRPKHSVLSYHPSNILVIPIVLITSLAFAILSLLCMGQWQNGVVGSPSQIILSFFIVLGVITIRYNSNILTLLWGAYFISVLVIIVGAVPETYSLWLDLFKCV